MQKSSDRRYLLRYGQPAIVRQMRLNPHKRINTQKYYIVTQRKAHRIKYNYLYCKNGNSI